MRQRLSDQRIVLRRKRSRFGVVRIFTTMVAASFLLSCNKTDKVQLAKSNGHSVRIAESRGDLPGDLWIGDLQPIQNWFTTLAVEAHEKGYEAGCQEAALVSLSPGQNVDLRVTELCPPPKPREQDPMRDAFRYRDEITEYYQRYPGHRDVPLDYLLYMLMSPHPLSLDEIHGQVSMLSQPRRFTIQ
jgi:hypothetical protein